LALKISDLYQLRTK